MGRQYGYPRLSGDTVVITATIVILYQQSPGVII